MLILDEDKLKELEQLVETNTLPYYRFYNTAIPVHTQHMFKLRNAFKFEDTKTMLNKTFIDIEVFVPGGDTFPDPDKALFEINSVALYNNVANQANIFFLVKPEYGMTTDSNYYKDRCLHLYNESIVEKPMYAIENISINIFTYLDEKELLRDMFKNILDFDTHILEGFNSSFFDMPYLINRAKNLFGNYNYKFIISEFGQVSSMGKFNVEIADYSHIDILDLYKPASEGGAGLGKSLNNYRLDNIAEVELQLNKIESDLPLHLEYTQDPAGFAFYNFIDTILVYKLDQKLNIVSITDALRKINFATFTDSARGRSLIYASRNFQYHMQFGEKIRSILFTPESLIDIGDIEVKDIKAHARHVKVNGAYVKMPNDAQIHGIEDNVIIMNGDATSMYPSCMKQYNISHQTIQAKVYDYTILAPFLTGLKTAINNKDKTEEYYQAFVNTIPNLLTAFIEKRKLAGKKVDKKKEFLAFHQQYIPALIRVILNKADTYEQLCAGTDNKHKILLKSYLYPLLENIYYMHQKQKTDYCQTLFDYVILEEADFLNKHKEVLLIDNIFNSNSELKIISAQDFITNYARRYIINCFGTLFIKHEELFSYNAKDIQEGMKKRKIANNIKAAYGQLYEELNGGTKMADNFRKLLNDIEPDLSLVTKADARIKMELYDAESSGIKLFLNSGYGIYAMADWFFSNINIGNSITFAGKMAIKIAHQVSHNYINNL